MAAVNLALRFVLEICVLVAVVVAALTVLDGAWSIVVAVVAPLALITMWGVFNVPDDPSRGGEAPVPVAGVVRLVIEAVYFAVGVVATYLAASAGLAVVFSVAVVVHYLFAVPRVRWLLSQ